MLQNRTHLLSIIYAYIHHMIPQVSHFDLPRDLVAVNAKSSDITEGPVISSIYPIMNVGEVTLACFLLISSMLELEQLIKVAGFRLSSLFTWRSLYQPGICYFSLDILLDL